MSKIAIIIACIVIVLAAVGTGAYLFSQKTNNQKGSTNNSATSLLKNIQKDPEAAADKTYEDSAGFSFGYPKDITVSDTTPDDEKYYTMLTLQKGSQKLTISAIDSSAKTVPTPTGSTLAGATTLGSISAQQFSSATTLTTIALDSGVLYTIDAPKDGGYLESVYNLIIETFKFSGQTKVSAPSTSSGGSDILYEDEEIVE